MNRYVAEFLGTFILVFCGTGAIVINQETGGAITHVGVALTFGLVVFALIQSLGHISGAHMNPAVTVALALTKRFRAAWVPWYILSQLTGAAAASLLLRVLFPANQLLGSTLPAGSELQSLLLEVILTFVLMLVILNAAVSCPPAQKVVAGAAIGSTVALEALFAGPICGASMNPARSLAPAVVSGHIEHLWLYIVGPICGAALAVPVWHYLHLNNHEQQ